MTPDDIDSDLERLARRPRAVGDIDTAWARLRAATVDIDPGRRGGNAPGPARALAWRPSLRTLAATRGRLAWRGAVVGAGMITAAAIAMTARVPRSGTRTGGNARTYATGAGQRAVLTIAGARVTLAPLTTVRVDGRIIELMGRAHFDVTPIPGAPLVVRTRDAVTRVLGTRFEVRRYAGDRDTRVVVTAGKVSVAPSRPGAPADARRAAVLAAGMVGLAGDSLVNVTTPDNATAITEWAQGRLVFQEAPVSEVLTTVGQWYGLEFRLATRDSAVLAAQHVTAAFDIRSTANALAAIAALLDVTPSVNGHIVTLQPRDHARPAAPRRAPRDVFPTTAEVGR